MSAAGRRVSSLVSMSAAGRRLSSLAVVLSMDGTAGRSIVGGSWFLSSLAAVRISSRGGGCLHWLTMAGRSIVGGRALSMSAAERAAGVIVGGRALDGWHGGLWGVGCVGIMPSKRAQVEGATGQCGGGFVSCKEASLFVGQKSKF